MELIPCRHDGLNAGHLQARGHHKPLGLAVDDLVDGPGRREDGRSAGVKAGVADFTCVCGCVGKQYYLHLSGSQKHPPHLILKEDKILNLNSCWTCAYLGVIYQTILKLKHL